MGFALCSRDTFFLPCQSRGFCEGAQQRGAGWNLQQLLTPDVARDARCHLGSAIPVTWSREVLARGCYMKLAQGELFGHRQHGGEVMESKEGNGRVLIEVSKQGC